MSRPATTFSLASLLATSCLALTSAASADLISWTNASGDGLWSNVSNWDLGRKPVGTDIVFVTTPGNDPVVLNGGIGSAQTLISSHPIQLQSGATLNIFDTAHFNGGLTMLGTGGTPFIVNHGAITVGSQANFYAGFVLQDAGTTFTFEHDCSATIWNTTSFIRGYVLNSGSLHLKAPLFASGFNSNETITVVNHADGWIYVEDPAAGLDSSNLVGAANFINYGKCNFNAGGFIHYRLATYNLGNFTVLGGQLSVDNLQSIDSQGTLLEGNYWLFNGARLAQSNNVIRTVAPGAFVYLAGKNGQGVSSFMDGLYAAENVNGTIYVDSGAELTLAPDFFGTVKNHGTIGVGPGAKITVNGGYVCYADGTHAIAIADASPTGGGIFQTYSSMQLAGTLKVDFYDDTLPTIPGQSFVVAKLVDPQSGFIGGEFDQSMVLPANGYTTHVEYGQGVVSLVTGAGCVADLDGSGGVDGADLATLLGSWGSPGASDFDQSGATDGADLATLLGAWGACN